LRVRCTIAIVCGHSKRVSPTPQEALMVQTTNRFFDEMARLMNDAAGAAQGVRREFETLFRSQAERVLREFDLVRRDDFEAVRDMARIAREENELLKARVAALEAALGKAGILSEAPSVAHPDAAGRGPDPGAVAGTA
jgi:BMFP domain-containing protein YqiC